MADMTLAKGALLMKDTRGEATEIQPDAPENSAKASSPIEKPLCKRNSSPTDERKSLLLYTKVWYTIPSV